MLIAAVNERPMVPGNFLLLTYTTVSGNTNIFKLNFQFVLNYTNVKFCECFLNRSDQICP